MTRLREGLSATETDQPSQWARCSGDAYAPAIAT